MTSSYADQPIAAFLDAVAAPEPAPGGGAVAAVTTAMAAGLVAMAAGFSRSRFDGAEKIADRAVALRDRALALAGEDAVAYAAVLDAYALPKDQDDRRQRIRAALERACDVPLAIADIASEVAALAVTTAAEGNPNLEGDAATAAHLATAAARSTAELTRINARLGDLGPEPGQRAARYVAIAAAAAERWADDP